MFSWDVSLSAGCSTDCVVPGETSNRLLPRSQTASVRLASVMCCCSSFVLNVEQAVVGLGLLVWDDVECVSDQGCLLQSLHCQQHQINEIRRQMEAIIVQHSLRHACRGMCNSLLYSTDMSKPCNMLIAFLLLIALRMATPTARCFIQLFQGSE